MRKGGWSGRANAGDARSNHPGGERDGGGRLARGRTRGALGPAAAVAATNDSDVRQQLENLGLRMPAKDQLTPETPGAWQKAEKNRLTGSLRRLLAIWAALQFL